MSAFKKWLHQHDGGKRFPESKGKQIENDKWFPFILDYFNQGAKTITINLKGISMRPFLESDRDRALLAPIGEVKVGDPVLAENYPGHFVLHRIIKLDGAWYEVDSTWDDSMRSTEGVYDQDVIEALMNPSFREKMGHYMFLISTEHMTHYEPNAEEFTYYSNAGWYIPFYEGMSSVHIRDSNHNGKAATGIGQIAMNSVIDTAPVADYDYGVYY